MGKRLLRLKEKPLENVPHGYSLSCSGFVRLFNSLFQYVEPALLWLWYRRIPLDRPIFIIGPFRSGTTILEEIIAGHPSVGYFGWFTNVYHRAPVAAYLATRLLFALGVVDRKKIPPLHNPRVRQNILNPYECEWVWSQSKDSQWDDNLLDLTVGPEFSDADFERYLFSIIRRHLFIHRATRFLNKNPVNCLRMGYLRKLFPDARIVTIVRDPIDTIRSHYRTATRVERVWYPDPKTKRIIQDYLHIDMLSMRIKTRNYAQVLALTQKHPLLGIARQWADLQLAVIKSIADDPDSADLVLQLRYETLVSQPTQVLEKLWNFLELEDKYAKKITLAHADRLIAPSPPHLTAEEREYLPQVQEIVAPVAAQLGYPAYRSLQQSLDAGCAEELFRTG
jgi:hypothetical protein